MVVGVAVTSVLALRDAGGSTATAATPGVVVMMMVGRRWGRRRGVVRGRMRRRCSRRGAGRRGRAVSRRLRDVPVGGMPMGDGVFLGRVVRAMVDRLDRRGCRSRGGACCG